MPINHSGWEAQTEQVSGYSGLPSDFQAIVRPCLTQIKNKNNKTKTTIKKIKSWAWWHIPINPALTG